MAGSDSNLNEHYGDDELTKIFVEEHGVDFDMTFAPDSDQTMLNVLIASGDLPDMMWLQPQRCSRLPSSCSAASSTTWTR